MHDYIMLYMNFTNKIRICVLRIILPNWGTNLTQVNFARDQNPVFMGFQAASVHFRI
jgi:hypothetical protein